MVADVLRLLTELDPYGLEPGQAGGAPADEYALEADPMASLLLHHNAITATQVDAVWQEWFDETMTEIVGASTVDRLVTQLNEISATRS